VWGRRDPGLAGLDQLDAAAAGRSPCHRRGTRPKSRRRGDTGEDGAQGINPNILLLDLFLYQRPGAWPQVVVRKPVRYDSVVRGMAYTEVSVLCDGKPIQDIKVEEVH